MEKLLDVIWYTETVQKVEQGFVISFVDLVSTLSGHVTILACLVGIKSLVRKDRGPRVLSPVPVPVPVNAPTAPLVPTGPLFVFAGSTGSNETVVPTRFKVPGIFHGRVRYLIHGWFGLWAGFVLFAQIYAESRSYGAIGCSLRGQPWFRTKVPCVVAEINCYRRGITGLEQEMDTVLNTLDELSLSTLLIRHCPALTVPPRVQTFPNILGIRLDNNTLVKWGADAVLKHANHPRMAGVTFLGAQMQGVPDGLLGDDLPHRLTTLTFLYTNLTGLPSSVTTSWSRVRLLAMEFCELHEIPPVIESLKSLNQLSVVGNQIESVPEFIFNSDTLALSNNPLKALPATVEKVGGLSLFFFEGTQVSRAPMWLVQYLSGVYQRGGFALASGYGSPVCTEPPQDELTAAFQQMGCTVNTYNIYGLVPYKMAPL